MTDKKTSRVDLGDGSVLTFAHPDDWSDAKIKAYARLNRSKATSTKSTDTPTDNKTDAEDITAFDLAKLGLSRFAVQFVPDVFLYSRDETNAALERSVGKSEGLFDTVGSTMMEGEAENPGAVKERKARQIAGVPVDAELGLGQEIIAGLSDPLTLAGTPIRAGVTKFLAGAVPAVTSTVAGTTGGVVAPQIVKELGGGEFAQEMAGAVAGGTAGFAAGAGVTPVVSTATRVGAEGFKKLTNAPEALANSQVRSELNQIKNTTKPEEVANSVNELARLKEEIPDLELGGILATMLDNAPARNWIKKTSAQNKAFQKEVNDLVQRETEKLADRFDAVAGIDPAAPVTRQEIEVVFQKEFDKQETISRDRIDRQTENIDKVLAGLTTRLTGTKDAIDVGRTANKLLDRKESMIRKEADKLYDVVNKRGKSVRLTDKQVFDVWNNFRNVRLQDMFGPQSKVGQQLEKHWKPTEVEDADGNMMFEMPKVTGSDLISLKKAVNTEITKLSKRNLRDDMQASQTLNKLYQTKEIIKQTMADKAKTAPTFIKGLRDADAFYYKELGLPMRAEGMRDFTAKRFDKGAADALMNYQQAEDYVSFVGKGGEAVVRHAIRLKAEKAGVIGADGNINQRQLDTFVRRNQRLIQRFGMAQEFADTAGRLRTIRNTEARHNQAFKEQSTKNAEGFFKTISNMKLSKVVAEMQSNPAKRKSYLEEINKLNETEKASVLSGIRQEFLMGSYGKSDSMADIVKRNSEFVDDVFGAGYAKNIQRLAAISDKLKKIDSVLLDSMSGSPVMDTVQESIGVSIPELAGTFRNQILSPQRKVINTVARSAITKGKDKFYSKSAEVLLDPDVVAELANPPTSEFAKAWKGSKEAAVKVGQYYVEALQGSLNLSTIKAFTAATDVATPAEQEELTRGAAAPQ